MMSSYCFFPNKTLRGKKKYMTKRHKFFNLLPCNLFVTHGLSIHSFPVVSFRESKNAQFAGVSKSVRIICCLFIAFSRFSTVICNCCNQPARPSARLLHRHVGATLAVARRDGTSRKSMNVGIFAIYASPVGRFGRPQG